MQFARFVFVGAANTAASYAVYLLLLGGDKSSQKRDIKRAIEMARALDKE